MKGKAIIFSAPSGAGKTTIVHSLLDRLKNLRFSVSATTRGKRPSEIDGRDYHFFSLDQFHEKIELGELLEWEQVYDGVFYGTLKTEVDRIWSQGNHVIFDVDVEGGKKLKEIFKDRALAIFIKVKSKDVLLKRLRARNTESLEMLKKRVEKSVLEMKEEAHFDQVILNEDLDNAIEETERTIKRFIGG